jgi:hypothetical protein
LSIRLLALSIHLLALSIRLLAYIYVLLHSNLEMRLSFFEQKKGKTEESQSNIIPLTKEDSIRTDNHSERSTTL